MKLSVKSILPYIVAIVAFVLFSLIYCSPLFEGKVLQAGDVTTYQGASQEIREYTEKEGHQVWWTNSMFGGMPSYQISGSTPANQIRNKLEHISYLGLKGNFAPAGIILGYLLGFFIMLLCFGVNPWISIAGSFAFTLSTYFMLIIPAGHITKAHALACLAPFIGGFYSIFRKKYTIGVPLILFYGIIGITLHPQMTYYIVMLLGVLFICELAIHDYGKDFKSFGISTAILLAATLLVFGTKISWYQMNQGYLRETMRGGHSELIDEENTADIEVSKGLDFEYATQWSYGKSETLTLLVPYFMGGASSFDLGKDSILEQELESMGVSAVQARNFCQGAPTYWGEKPFTSGPVYVGAIIFLLFVLGLIIVKGPYKWALLIATLFSITLAWGHNLEPWSRFFFDHFPMYNKFRAVESILVVAEITIPLLGFLAVKQLLENKGDKSNRKNILIATGITSLICLVVALFGRTFDVRSSFDAQWSGQVGDEIYNAILDQRHALMISSAWRSLLFVILGAAALLYFTSGSKKDNTVAFSAVLGLLILIDLVPVNRDFFGKQNFITKSQDKAIFAIQPWEEEILQDDALDFRVYNTTTSTFNDSRTSYRLKSIGGYSAAKLRRYQDLIDAHISKNNFQVLNMLNTKYLIVGDGQVLVNPEAFGNAWFVDETIFVGTANEESDALNRIDLSRYAVADEKFADVLSVSASEADSTASITMTSYLPDKLTYTSSSREDKVAVFSEIYYPEGWHLYIDGKEHPIGRADYTLRAAVIPAGQHEIVMEFVPDALKIDKLCVALLIISLLISLSCIVIACKKAPVLYP